MAWFRDISITRKQTLVILATSLVTLLFATAGFITYEIITFRKTMTDELAILAQVIGDNATSALGENDTAAAESMLLALRAHPHILEAKILGPNGEPIARYQRTKQAYAFSPEREEEVFSWNRDRVQLVQSVISDGERVGMFQIDSDLTQVHQRFSRYGLIVVGVFSGASLLALLMSSRLQRLISTPILHLVKVTRDVAGKQDYSIRARQRSQDELGRLIGAFNEMLEQIENRDRALQDSQTALERSNKDLDDFASVASHDLQEPLRTVRKFGERLKAKFYHEVGEKGQTYLDCMEEATDRMQTLIKDLLTYSRLTTKANPFEPVDLEQVMQGVLADLTVLVEQVDGTVDLGELPTVEAEPLQMRQLLQNLTSNALKFRRPESPPVVSVSGRLLNGNGTNGNGAPDPEEVRTWEISVRDNGIGFDQKHVDKVFKVFERLHGRSEYEGTGIGLAVCRKIVERHGGSITARSAKGEGSTFLFTLQEKQREESIGV
jgi:signal transduction histidine kinase